MAGMHRRVAVLGGGSWGTALSHVFASQGAETLLWLRDAQRADEINARHTNERYAPGRALSERLVATTDLEAAVRFAPLVLVVIPSKALRAVARQIGDHVSGDQILVSATKGLELEGLKRMSQVLREETCARKVGALSGPNLSAEVLAGHPSATVVASRFEEVIEATAELLAAPTLRVYGSFDIVGVELAGALKNIVAIAAGVSAEMGHGANTLALIVTRGLAEMARFGAAVGAKPLTFEGLAGIGDLVATAGSPLSRNHTVGRRLARGEGLDEIVTKLGMVAEGVNTTRVVHEHARRLGVDMPIAAGMHRLLFEGAAVEEVLSELMGRPSLYEVGHMPIGEASLVTESIVEHAAAIAHREGGRS